MKTDIYILKAPLWLILQPKLILYRKHNKKRIEGRIRWLFINKKLKRIKQREQEILFNFNIDIFCIDMVIKFYAEEAVEGFFDTPIGHIHFSSRRKRRLYRGKNKG